MTCAATSVHAVVVRCALVPSSSSFEIPVGNRTLWRLRIIWNRYIKSSFVFLISSVGNLHGSASLAVALVTLAARHGMRWILCTAVLGSHPFAGACSPRKCSGRGEVTATFTHAYDFALLSDRDSIVVTSSARQTNALVGSHAFAKGGNAIGLPIDAATRGRNKAATARQPSELAIVGMVLLRLIGDSSGHRKEDRSECRVFLHCHRSDFIVFGLGNLQILLLGGTAKIDPRFTDRPAFGDAKRRRRRKLSATFVLCCLQIPLSHVYFHSHSEGKSYYRECQIGRFLKFANCSLHPSSYSL